MRRLVFLLFALLCVLFLTLPAFSQAKHPFTFEDMMKLKRVGEPVPSPDGKWVLFTAVDVDLAANKKTPHIWIVPLAGGSNETGVPHSSPNFGRVGGERVLIPDQDGDRPRWAPDGKRFAFLSNKEGGSQIWIADFDGAAGTVTGVHKLTSIATEAGGELWSPDGKNILFTSDVYSECADEACNAKKLKEAEESKVKAIIFDRLLYRHWNAYKRGMRTHIFVVPADACVGTAAPAVQPAKPGRVPPPRPPATTAVELRSTGQPRAAVATRAPAISRPATTMRLCSRSAGRTTTPSRPTGRRFATPRITTRSKPLPPTTISGSSR